MLTHEVYRGNDYRCWSMIGPCDQSEKSLNIKKSVIKTVDEMISLPVMSALQTRLIQPIRRKAGVRL